MKNYVKPMVLANDELAEGVFAASGAADCWSVEIYPVQDWNGSHKVFEVKAVHSTAVVHISASSTFTFEFSSALSNAYSEFGCSVNGNTVAVTRVLLADSYHSGDLLTYKVWATTGDEATTKALSAKVVGIACEKTTNVQGGLD